jgi:hypothetical protein
MNFYDKALGSIHNLFSSDFSTTNTFVADKQFDFFLVTPHTLQALPFQKVAPDYKKIKRVLSSLEKINIYTL